MHFTENRQSQQSTPTPATCFNQIFPASSPGLDCTLEMRQPRWAHFAGKGLRSEAEAIRTEISADGLERMRSSDNIGDLAEELGVTRRALYKWRAKLDHIEPGR